MDAIQQQIHAGMNRDPWVTYKPRRVMASSGVLQDEFQVPYTIVERVASMEYADLPTVPHEELVDALMGCFHKFQTAEDRELAARYQFATVRIHAECLRRLRNASRQL